MGSRGWREFGFVDLSKSFFKIKVFDVYVLWFWEYCGFIGVVGFIRRVGVSYYFIISR